MLLRLLLVWLINAAALLAVGWLVPAVHLESVGSALVAALVLGLVNAVIRPLLILLTLPITLLTLGFFILVINGLLFLLVANVLEGFEVTGFWWAVLAALVFSLISWALSALVFQDRVR